MIFTYFPLCDQYVASSLRSIDRSLARLIRSEWMIDRIQTILHLLQSLHLPSYLPLPLFQLLLLFRAEKPHHLKIPWNYTLHWVCTKISLRLLFNFNIRSAEELPPGNTYWTIIEFPPIISRLLWLLVILSRRRSYSSSSLKLTLINIFHLSSIRRSYNCDLQRETRSEVKHWTGYGDNKHVTYLIAPLSAASTSSPGVSVHNKNHSKWLSFADSSSSSSPFLIRPAITLQIEQIKCKRLKE